MAITTNVITRTFRIKYGVQTGTCFTIDIDERQYIVTAKHIVADINPNDNIQILHEGKWKELTTNIVWIPNSDEDIAILAPEIRISPPFLLIPSMERMYLGQDLYFCGFPFGLNTEVGTLNRDFPVPFIKKGIVSAVETRENCSARIYIDGHNNPGFSGGPVIFTDPKTNELKVAGVISGYYPNYEPVLKNNNRTELMSIQNTGIVIAYALGRAVTYIEEHPTGVPAKPSLEDSG